MVPQREYTTYIITQSHCIFSVLDESKSLEQQVALPGTGVTFHVTLSGATNGSGFPQWCRPKGEARTQHTEHECTYPSCDTATLWWVCWCSLGLFRRRGLAVIVRRLYVGRARVNPRLGKGKKIRAPLDNDIFGFTFRPNLIGWGVDLCRCQAQRSATAGFQRFQPLPLGRPHRFWNCSPRLPTILRVPIFITYSPPTDLA